MDRQTVFKAMDFASTTCRQKIEEGHGENPGFSGIRRPSRGRGYGKGDREGREEKEEYEVFKHKKGQNSREKMRIIWLKSFSGVK